MKIIQGQRYKHKGSGTQVLITRIENKRVYAKDIKKTYGVETYGDEYLFRAFSTADGPTTLGLDEQFWTNITEASQKTNPQEEALAQDVVGKLAQLLVGNLSANTAGIEKHFEEILRCFSTNNRIGLIKVFREVTQCGLKEAKEAMDRVCDKVKMPTTSMKVIEQLRTSRTMYGVQDQGFRVIAQQGKIWVVEEV